MQILQYGKTILLLPAALAVCAASFKGYALCRWPPLEGGGLCCGGCVVLAEPPPGFLFFGNFEFCLFSAELCGGRLASEGSFQGNF